MMPTADEHSVRSCFATGGDTLAGEPALDGVGARGEAVLLPEHRFDELERPELFGDALHMNQQGAVEFSAMLAREMNRMLGR